MSGDVDQMKCLLLSVAGGKLGSHSGTIHPISLPITSIEGWPHRQPSMPTCLHYLT